MTTNDLVFKIAERAKILANKPINDLRAHLPSNQITRAGVVAEYRHLSRGDLVEEILIDEFIEEFPKEIAEE